MSDSVQTVIVVDDDEAVRDSLSMLLQSVGIHHHLYASAHSLLDDLEDLSPGCLLLDIRMPGMSGLELQEELRERQFVVPIIFITGHGDIEMAVEAMRKGAMDFIQKPFREQDLLDRIHEALAWEAGERKHLHDLEILRNNLKSLTNREHEVFKLVTDGLANKVIAYDLGVSERTVEVHRAQAMRKMGARNLAQLVRKRQELEQSEHPTSFSP